MASPEFEPPLTAPNSRQQPSPEIYLASAIVDGSPPIWPVSIVVKKPDDARRSVDEIQASGYTRVRRDAYFALASQQQSLMIALNRAEYFRDRLADTADAYRGIDQARCQALFAQFRGDNTWQVSALSVLRIWGLLNESKLTSEPGLAYIGKKSRERWQERIQPRLRTWNNSQYQFARSIFSR